MNTPAAAALARVSHRTAVSLRLAPWRRSRPS